MTTITIKEAAEIKCCTVQYLQKQALNGEISTVIELTKNNRKRYMIPLSEFTTEEQIKYYQSHDMPLPEELEKPKKTKKTVSRSTNIEDYTADQRDEMAFWHKILQEWDSYCFGKPSKVQATKEFVEMTRKKYPDIKISSDILYRRQRSEKENGICGQVDGRGGHNKGSSVIPDVVWNTFLSFYLDQNKFPQTQCYEYTQLVVEQECPELLPLPSYRTFSRHIQSDVSFAVKTLGREGEKAFKDRCAPYIKRIYDNLESNDYWFGDNHTLDIESIGKNGKIHRLHLSAFQDARSGIITGFYLSDGNTGQSTLLSLRKGIIVSGCPEMLYLDNGREYMVTDIAGLGHRQKKSTADRQNPPTVLARLDVGLINALVRNAQAKNIERTFLDVKNKFSRLFDTFVGGNILERPEKLKLVLKGKFGDIPTDEEVAEALDTMINGYFNLAPYNGPVVKDRGKPKIQVFQENLKVKRVILEEDLNLMLMRSSRIQTVGQRGVHFGDIDYWNDDLLAKYSGCKVYYRYDPDDLSSVRIYDLEDRYLMTVPADNKAVCEFGTSQDKLKAALKTVGNFKKITKQALEAQTATVFGKKSALELVLAKAEKNKEIQIAEGNHIIEIQRANEKMLEQAVGAEVDVDNIVSYDRMIKNLERSEE